MTDPSRRTNVIELAEVDPAGPAAGGVAVVVDVIRAFTTQAVAARAGVERFVCVESLDDAFALKACWPDSVLMGEDGGVPLEGFDLGNSPVPFLTGRTPAASLVVQRTSNGTRGLERSPQPTLYAASAVNASATVAHIADCHPEAEVTIGRAGLRRPAARAGRGRGPDRRLCR